MIELTLKPRQSAGSVHTVPIIWSNENRAEQYLRRKP